MIYLHINPSIYHNFFSLVGGYAHWSCCRSSDDHSGMRLCRSHGGAFVIGLIAGNDDDMMMMMACDDVEEEEDRD